MYFLRIPLAVVALTAITLSSAHAMSPRVTERVPPAQAGQSDRQTTGGFSNAALPATPGVLDALADENNMLVYVRVSQARHAAYYSEAKSRCDMYRGKARATCAEEARLKYGPPRVSPPL